MKRIQSANLSFEEGARERYAKSARAHRAAVPSLRLFVVLFAVALVLLAIAAALIVSGGPICLP